MIAVLALSFAAALVPHSELPATFSGGRLFVMPLVANSSRRLALWVDSDGDGFIREKTVTELKLQTVTQLMPQTAQAAYLPRLDERDFPPPTANHGVLPILQDTDVSGDPVFSGFDGQLGWTWLTDRIWTIDYAGHHLYWDHTAPAYSARSRVGLEFDRMHRYPQLDITVDEKTYRAALDTAASVALSPKTIAAMNDELPAVRATSFIPRRIADAWHAAHSDWPYIANAGASKGISLIRVPQVQAGRVVFHDVWFSTRPGDDVFSGETVEAKLGPTAFSKCAVTLDYVHDAAGFECE